MKIGIMNIERKIVNTALMQISNYHKTKGDSVEWYSALFHNNYDKIYCSSLFTATPKPEWLFSDPRVSFGGTGFNNTVKLPAEIEQCNYDWSLYPKCDYSIIWFSRGCINNCSFCVVREKEGYIKSVKHKNLNPNSIYIKIMDNNFFANPNWKKAITQLQAWKQPCDFQGIDVRIMNEEMAQALNSVKHAKQIHIAWDLPKQDITEQLEMFTTWVKPYKIMCYVLVGYNSTLMEDYNRIMFLRKLKIDPFVMKYNHRKDIVILNHLARWVNRKELFKSCTFDDYLTDKDYTDVDFDWHMENKGSEIEDV